MNLWLVPRKRHPGNPPPLGGGGCQAFQHRPGGVFPDYGLPDHTGTVRTLSELQGRDPLILTLARGNYCPKEHQQHLDLAANYPKIAVAYAQVATPVCELLGIERQIVQAPMSDITGLAAAVSNPGRARHGHADLAR